MKESNNIIIAYIYIYILIYKKRIVNNLAQKNFLYFVEKIGE